ncbi:hypothetical protein [Carp edema virus]|nr:hypothetical protein [Carp edema virus]
MTSLLLLIILGTLTSEVILISLPKNETNSTTVFTTESLVTFSNETKTNLTTEFFLNTSTNTSTNISTTNSVNLSSDTFTSKQSTTKSKYVNIDLLKRSFIKTNRFDEGVVFEINSTEFEKSNITEIELLINSFSKYLKLILENLTKKIFFRFVRNSMMSARGEVFSKFDFIGMTSNGNNSLIDFRKNTGLETSLDIQISNSSKIDISLQHNSIKRRFREDEYATVISGNDIGVLLISANTFVNQIILIENNTIDTLIIERNNLKNTALFCKNNKIKNIFVDITKKLGVDCSSETVAEVVLDPIQVQKVITNFYVNLAFLEPVVIPYPKDDSKHNDNGNTKDDNKINTKDVEEPTILKTNTVVTGVIFGFTSVVILYELLLLVLLLCEHRTKTKAKSKLIFYTNY